MIRMYKVAAVLVLFASIVAVPNVFAQQLRISGTVDDGTGVIAGATVTLRDPGGVTSQVTTDATGRYHFDGLRAGTYELTISHDGYASSSRSVMLTGESGTADVTLKIAEVLTSIDVVDIGGLATSLTVPTTAGNRLNL